MKEPKVCPECGHRFRGSGWDGIDAHWRSKHDHIMRYEEAWPLLRDGKYPAAPFSGSSGDVPMTEDVMSRLRKLLRLAAGTANLAEANVAAVKAAELMRQRQIDPDALFRIEEIVIEKEASPPPTSPRKRNARAEAFGRLIGWLLWRIRFGPY